ncbi:probable ATP-dependent RNA helicase DDX20, partial [Nephila pilipes]
MSKRAAHIFDEKWRSNDVIIQEDADFSSFLLSDKILAGLENAGYKHPSPIQLEAIPIGRMCKDLIVQAKSGTGKTLIFAVIALEMISDVKCPQVLILAPAREIAVQICDIINAIGCKFKKLTCNCFIGGFPVEEDKTKAYGCQIVVGTPGRIRQLIVRKILMTNSIRLLVLDEADQLLQSSFKSDLDAIFQMIPKEKQVIATSATYPRELKKFVQLYFKEPHLARLNVNELSLLGLVNYFHVVPVSEMPVVAYSLKLKALEGILKTVKFTQCLIFCNLISRVGSLCSDISKWGFSTTYISSAKEQSDRLKAIKCLKHFKCKVLVSSDVTSRGIDAENVDFVVNFDLPYKYEIYLHRVGRGGRYGSKCASITFIDHNEIDTYKNMQVDGHFKSFLLPDPVPTNLINYMPIEQSLLENELDNNCESSSILDNLSDSNEEQNGDTDDCNQNEIDKQKNDGCISTSDENFQNEVFEEPAIAVDSSDSMLVDFGNLSSISENISARSIEIDAHFPPTESVNSSVQDENPTATLNTLLAQQNMELLLSEGNIEFVNNEDESESICTDTIIETAHETVKSSYLSANNGTESFENNGESKSATKSNLNAKKDEKQKSNLIAFPPTFPSMELKESFLSVANFINKYENDVSNIQSPECNFDLENLGEFDTVTFPSSFQSLRSNLKQYYLRVFKEFMQDKFSDDLVNKFKDVHPLNVCKNIEQEIEGADAETASYLTSYVESFKTLMKMYPEINDSNECLNGNLVNSFIKSSCENIDANSESELNNKVSDVSTEKNASKIIHDAKCFINSCETSQMHLNSDANSDNESISSVLDNKCKDRVSSSKKQISEGKYEQAIKNNETKSKSNNANTKCISNGKVDNKTRYSLSKIPVPIVGPIPGNVGSENSRKNVFKSESKQPFELDNVKNECKRTGESVSDANSKSEPESKLKSKNKLLLSVEASKHSDNVCSKSLDKQASYYSKQSLEDACINIKSRSINPDEAKYDPLRNNLETTPELSMSEASLHKGGTELINYVDGKKVGKQLLENKSLQSLELGGSQTIAENSGTNSIDLTSKKELKSKQKPSINKISVRNIESDDTSDSESSSESETSEEVKHNGAENDPITFNEIDSDSTSSKSKSSTNKISKQQALSANDSSDSDSSCSSDNEIDFKKLEKAFKKIMKKGKHSKAQNEKIKIYLDEIQKWKESSGEPIIGKTSRSSSRCDNQKKCYEHVSESTRSLISYQSGNQRKETKPVQKIKTRPNSRLQNHYAAHPQFDQPGPHHAAHPQFDQPGPH